MGAPFPTDLKVPARIPIILAVLKQMGGGGGGGGPLWAVGLSLQGRDWAHKFDGSCLDDHCPN